MRVASFCYYEAMSGEVDQGSRRRRPRGTVYLVGAGPGDPELLTVRAHRLIGEAEVLAFDELVPDAIVELAPPRAERIRVGRRAGGCRHHEARIHPGIVERALEGVAVVRLKGGDPYVFGRGGEEAEELAAVGIPFQVVPGISAGLAAAAQLHIPLTYREVSRAVTFATAHATSGDADLGALPSSGTIVLYMGLGRLAQVATSLISAGRMPETPACVVSHAGQAGERSVQGTRRNIAERVDEAALKPPAVIIIGEVVAHAVASPAPPERLGWLEKIA